VKVYSNAGKLNLKLNGKDMGSVSGHNGVYVWKQIRLEPGKNVVSVSGKKGGLFLSDECEWNLEKQD
jgi:beta-galactosidase